MILHRLSFGNREFAIPHSTDVIRLKQEVLDAVQGGGGYVTIPRPETKTGELEILFTAAIPVQWEEVEFSEEDFGSSVTEDSGHDDDY